MKIAFFTMSLLVGFAAQAEVCKTADLKECVKALKALEGKDEFNASYDQVCTENKTFKCLKRTVRGDTKEELKYMKTEFPKATFFTTKENGEDKVFVLDKK